MNNGPDNLQTEAKPGRRNPFAIFYPPLLLAVLCVLASVHIQASDMAKLHTALQRKMPDTSRIKLLFELGDALTDQGNYDEARKPLTESLNLARRIKNPVLEGKSLKRIGNTWFYQGNNQAAMKHWQLATVIAQRRGDMGEYYSLRANMANVLMVTGNHPAAQQAYLEALHWAETNNVKSEVVKCLINLAALYSSQERFDSAQLYLERALRAYETDMDPYLKVNILNNLAVIESRHHNIEGMERWAGAMLEFSRKEGMNRFVGGSYEILGMASMERGRHIEGRTYMDKALQIHTENRDDREKTSTMQRIAELDLNAVLKKDEAYLDRFFNGKQSAALAEARALLDTVIVFFREQEEADQLCNAYESLSGVARAQGDPEAALEYYMQFKQLSDSLFNAERDKRLTEKAMTYAFNKKEAATRAEQEKKDQRQRFIRNSIIAILVIVLLFLAVVWRQRNRINKERKRSEELLLNILPEEVAAELKEKGAAEAKHFDCATVLFTDFKGFTQLSEKVTPSELVEELNSCFKAFDTIIDRYGIEKIKTIGDAYMAAGGLPDPKKGSPAEVVRAALEMQEFMRSYKAGREAEGKPFFEMRAGIHTGQLVAGIVGVKKFQYDIWGDTVNTASRMESSGEAGRVNISGATYELVKDQFTCIRRGKVQAKGKGEMEMYFVEKLDDRNTPDI